MRRLADPVLTNLANGTLKTRMPVEQAANADRRSVTHLEVLGRLIAGIAPWIELQPDDNGEGRRRSEYAAFLAQGILRAPRALGDALDPSTKRSPHCRAAWSGQAFPIDHATGWRLRL